MATATATRRSLRRPSPPMDTFSTRMWLFLLVIFLSASVANPIRDISSERGNCHHGFTSVAAFSCVMKNNSWQRQTPSLTCCRALLYAIDDIPPSGESGACCLCRYLTQKYRSSELVAAYIFCKGKDRHEVAKWSELPGIGTCSRVCPKNKNKDRPVVNGADNTSFKTLGIVVAVAIVMGLVCFWYYWRFKPAANPNENHAKSLDGDGRGESKQYSTRSSRRGKGRRLSSSSPNS